MARPRVIRRRADEIGQNPGRLDRAKLDATTEEDIRRHMIEDGEDPDAEVREEDIISPAAVRKRLGLSQAQFARLLNVPLGTLRNWEQHRTRMEPAAVSLMIVLAREPEAALRALKATAA